MKKVLVVLISWITRRKSEKTASLSDSIMDSKAGETLITSKRKLRSILKYVSVNLGLFMALFLLLEVIFRIADIPFDDEWTPTENAIAQFDKDLGWSYIPNIARRINFGDRTIAIYINGDGIRAPSPGFQFLPEAPSILFIGCSYAMGHGLSYEDSFVGQFAALPGTPWQTVNLGVQAYGTDQAYLALMKFAPMFNVKVVVYTFLEKHIIRNGNHDRRLLYPDARFLGTKPQFSLTNKQELILSKKPKPYDDYLHSHFYDALRITLGPRLGVFPPYPEMLTHVLIQQMNNYCKERGIRFILLNWRWNLTDYNFTSPHFDVIDTLENAPPDWERMKLHDTFHPNETASSHVANLLHAKIAVGP